MSGIKSSSFHGSLKPKGVPNPTRKAIKGANLTNSILPATGYPPSSTISYRLSATSGTVSKPSAVSDLVYSRRYLDWNRLTFAYHAVGSQDRTFDLHKGARVSHQITNARKSLNLTALYGCAPKTYCQYCKPFGADGNIYTLLETALGATVINSSRANVPRIIIINTGSIRFDLVQGPFTL